MDDRHEFDSPDLAELVGSRLCHDLVNPLSAISNGIELLTLSGVSRTPEIALIADAVGDAMARIRFFRVGFGAARAGESLSERELRDILAALYAGSRLRVDWQVAGDLPRREARVGFLMLSCAETALPLGGSLAVSREDGAWQLAGSGRKLAVDEDLWRGLQQPSVVLRPPAARIQFALLARALEGRAAPLSVHWDEGEKSLLMRLPAG